MPDPPVTLPAHCERCREPVTLTVGQWPMLVWRGEPQEPPTLQGWLCPWCDEPNEIGIAGPVTLVQKGHDGQTED